MINNDNYKIEKGVPIPIDEIERKTTGKQGRLPKYNFLKMEVSDSVIINPEYNSRDRRNANDAAKQFTLNHKLEWEFLAGKCPNDPNDKSKGFHTRLWRTK